MPNEPICDNLTFPYHFRDKRGTFYLCIIFCVSHVSYQLGPGLDTTFLSGALLVVNVPKIGRHANIG